MFIVRSLEKESRNSSHSSIMSKSVLGFLPIWLSIWYFIELKIRTSASRYAVYWSVYGQPFFLLKSANSFPEIDSYLIFFTSFNPFGFISDGISGAQYGQVGAMFILLMSEAFEKSLFSTAGFFAMYFRRRSVFFSLSSIVHGISGLSAVSPLNGHGKLFLPFMTAIFRGLLFLPKMNLSLE